MWARMGAKEAVSAWHWSMLAQPDGLAEKLVGGDSEWFVRYILAHQSAPGFVFPQDNLADYLACARDPRSIHTWAEDYRAGWTIDRELDEKNRGWKLDMWLAAGNPPSRRKAPGVAPVSRLKTRLKAAIDS